MEQKRTLWIIAAAGIFLLVVIGAALILYSPSMQTQAVKQANFDPNIGWISTPKREDAAAVAQAESQQDASDQTAAPDADGLVAKAEDTDSSSTGANPGAVQSNPFETPLKTSHITVVTDNTTVYSTDTTPINLNVLNSTNVSAKNKYTEAKMNSVSAKAADTPKREATESAKASSPTSAKSVAQAAAPKPKTAASAKTQPAPKTAPAPEQTKFWVQAAAYSSKKNADEARSVLESNKIPTEVFTVDSNGTTMYRVRVGPYTTKTEAEYWQKEIAKIEKFSDAKSQIFNTKVN